MDERQGKTTDRLLLRVLRVARVRPEDLALEGVVRVIGVLQVLQSFLQFASGALVRLSRQSMLHGYSYRLHIQPAFS